MTIEQLREVHQNRPFRPFTLELADGSRVEVPHPEFLAFLKSGRTVFVATQGEAFKIIDLLLVSAIDVQNGQMKHPERN